MRHAPRPLARWAWTFASATRPSMGATSVASVRAGCIKRRPIARAILGNNDYISKASPMLDRIWPVIGPIRPHAAGRSRCSVVRLRQTRTKLRLVVPASAIARRPSPPYCRACGSQLRSACSDRLIRHYAMGKTSFFHSLARIRPSTVLASRIGTVRGWAAARGVCLWGVIGRSACSTTCCGTA